MNRLRRAFVALIAATVLAGLPGCSSDKAEKKVDKAGEKAKQEAKKAKEKAKKAKKDVDGQ